MRNHFARGSGDGDFPGKIHSGGVSAYQRNITEAWGMIKKLAIRNFGALIGLFVFLSIYSSVSFAREAAHSPLLPEQFPQSFNDNVAHNQDFTVITAKATARPCIAVASQDKDIVVLISRSLLEKLAALGKGKASLADVADPERLNAIYGRRASSLLESVTAAHDENDCSPATTNTETQYLIGRLLASGQVSILDATSGRIVPSIVASVSSMPGVAGMVAYQLRDTPTGFRTFLSFQAWVH